MLIVKGRMWDKNNLRITFIRISNQVLFPHQSAEERDFQDLKQLFVDHSFVINNAYQIQKGL